MSRNLVKKTSSRIIQAILVVILGLVAVKPVRCEISIPSYLLRDRAVVLDTLVMRKRMLFAFTTTLTIEQIKGCAAVGTLSHQGEVMARDTTWLFDEAAGNFGFCLPFEIPGGTYHLDIVIEDSEGRALDRYSDDFEREYLKAYFNRATQYWDFTTPYAHLACRGYGSLSYSFESDEDISGIGWLELAARMGSSGRQPSKVRLELNGATVGEFVLQPVENYRPEVISFRAEGTAVQEGLKISKGKNTLVFVIEPDSAGEGGGIHIYSHKNSPDPDIEEAVPVTLELKYGNSDKKFSIPVWGEEGEHVTGRFTIPGPKSFELVDIRTEQQPLPLEQSDVRQGYVVFSRDFQRYVHHWSIPSAGEKIDSLGLRMSRNDYEPLTFSLYPIRDLGGVVVSVSDLAGPDGAKIASEDVAIHVAKTVKQRTGGGNGYMLVPRMLDRICRADIPTDYTTRFWLTVHAGRDLEPGIYRGSVSVSAEKERDCELPLTVEVMPITLEPVEGIAYSMFMTYEFFELESKDWTVQEREKIYRDGVSVFRDFKAHGMSTVDVSSPYYFQWNRDGSARLEHYKAMVRAAKEVGFTDPIFWYFAHYLQAAKAFHPGNVRIYDPDVHPARAKVLAKTALELAGEVEGAPPVWFVPIDEPRVESRQKITLQLLEAIRQVPGVFTMSSTDIGGKMLDIENNSQMHRKALEPGEKERKSEREVWEYNNSVIQCFNPAYSRYVYGYYTWRQDLDGMNSWGFNTAENSRAHPYEDLDHEREDWNLAYPHPGGPLPTPNWEALREGIEDIRYVDQLEKLCRARAASNPDEVARAETFLDAIRDMCDIDDRQMINEFGDWTPERFELLRNKVISWIITLQTL